MDTENRPYIGGIKSIEQAISQLEGWAFGCPFKFMVIGSTLNHGLGKGWDEVHGFDRLPELDKFAKDLNAAIAPVIQAYSKFLRQEMANECIKVAEKALR